MRAALAQASLVRHRARTALAILGVAVAAAMLLDMVMLARAMRQSFKELLLTRGFQLRLSPKGTLPFDTDATIRDVAGVTTTLRRNPDIGEISTVLVFFSSRRRHTSLQGDWSSDVCSSD